MVSSDGQIGLYWSRGDKYADINFDGDGTISIYARDSSYETPIESYLEGANPFNRSEQWVPMLLDLLVPLKAAA